MKSPLRVGFIGLGAISHENVLGYLDNEKARIEAVCRRDTTQAEAWIRKYGLDGVRIYSDYDEMLQNGDFDIVEILTPHHLHREQVVKCAESGVRAISLQKPMATSLAECDEIIDVCKARGVLLKVYENFRFYPVYMKAKELIDSGLLGELSSIRVCTMSGVRDHAKLPWCWQPGSWSLDLSRSGVGPLIGDDGTHKFSLASWLMSRPIERVSSWVDGESPLDAPAFIRARFERMPEDSSYKYAQIDFTFSAKMALPFDFWLDDFVEVVGDRAVMWINQCSAAGNRQLFSGNEMSLSPAFPPIAVYTNGKVETYLSDLSPSQRNWSTSFVNSTHDFFDTIEEGRAPECTGEEGRELLRYVFASMLSAQEGRDVGLDEITTEAERKGSFSIDSNFCNLSHPMFGSEVV